MCNGRRSFTANDRALRTSIVIAIWPTERLIEPTRSKQVGCITKLIKHKVTVRTSVSIKEQYHLFCAIDWYVRHARDDWYGFSAIVCNNFTYSENDCSYMPIQRILNRCAFGKVQVDFSPGQLKENVFVAIPIMLKY